jgi:hypothetical protein
MSIMTETANNFGWCDPHSADYRPDIVQLIEDVAANKVDTARKRWQINVAFEDLQSELYAHLLTYPKIIEGGKFPSKVLHNEAAKFCFKQRTDQGAAIIGTDTLHLVLTDYNNIPDYIYKILNGPVFAKAGKPAGKYLEVIEQEYKYSNKIVGTSNRKTLARAVTRLAELISGVMVGTPDSFTHIANQPGMPTYLDECEDFYEDATSAPYVGIYYCNKGHGYRISTGAKPENKKIGQAKLLGYYTCRCGNILTLDTREVIGEG